MLRSRQSARHCDLIHRNDGAGVRTPTATTVRNSPLPFSNRIPKQHPNIIFDSAPLAHHLTINHLRSPILPSRPKPKLGMAFGDSKRLRCYPFRPILSPTVRDTRAGNDEAPTVFETEGASEPNRAGGSAILCRTDLIVACGLPLSKRCCTALDPV
jgi:hypothetical protein